jgi:transcriptional regulator with XRE-family HTH domain
MRNDSGSAVDIATRGPITGAGLRTMRTALGLSGVGLARLLHAGQETVSRWENEAQAVDPWAFLVVGSLVLDAAEGRTAMRDRLASVRAPRHEDEVRRELVDFLRLYLETKADRRDFERRRGAATREIEGLSHGAWIKRKADWAREEKPELEAAEEARIVDAMEVFCDATAKTRKTIEALLRKTESVSAALTLAARIGWELGIEGPREGKYSAVQRKIEGRYRRAMR